MSDGPSFGPLNRLLGSQVPDGSNRNVGEDPAFRPFLADSEFLENFGAVAFWEKIRMSEQTAAQVAAEFQVDTEILGIIMKTLEVHHEDIISIEQDGSEERFEIDLGSREYLMLSDSKADEALKEYIKETAWAFNADFLAWNTELPEEAFTGIQEQCESANPAVLAMIEKTCGLDEFVKEAEKADGRGHFLSNYDSVEIDGPENWYFYRTA